MVKNSPKRLIWGLLDMRVNGFWYQANHSMRHVASVELGADIKLMVEGGDEVQSFEFDEVAVSARVANIERWFQLPDRSGFTTNDNSSIDEWLAQREDQAPSRLLHTLESNKLSSLAAVMVTITIAALLLVKVIPATAPVFAELVPVDVEVSIGQRVKAQLSGLTQVDEVTNESMRQREIRHDFLKMVEAVDSVYPYSLTYYRSVRANAFAVPGGVIYLSTGLLADATDEEVLGVLAHEIGHVEERHSLKLVMKQAGTVALISTLFGDFTGALGLGTVYLTGLSHSRDAEYSADAFAVKLLKQTNRDPRVLTSFFKKLVKEDRSARDQQNNGEDSAGEKESSPTPIADDYLSTHPAHANRIESIEKLLEEN